MQREDAEQEIDDGAGPSASVKQGGDIVRNDIGDPDARGQGQIADGRVQGSVAIGIFLCLIPVYPAVSAETGAVPEAWEEAVPDPDAEPDAEPEPATVPDAEPVPDPDAEPEPWFSSSSSFSM